MIPYYRENIYMTFPHPLAEITDAHYQEVVVKYKILMRARV